MFINKCIARYILREVNLTLCSSFLTFFCFAVECRVVYLQVTVYENTVCRNLVTRLQKDLVTYNNVVHFDNCNSTVSVSLTFIFFCTLFELSVLCVAGNACFCRNSCNYKDSNNCSDRLIDLSLAKEKHNDHDSRNYKQYLDHRVAEGFLKFRPERGRFGIRYHVGAMFFP